MIKRLHSTHCNDFGKSQWLALEGLFLKNSKKNYKRTNENIPFFVYENPIANWQRFSEKRSPPIFEKAYFLHLIRSILENALSSIARSKKMICKQIKLIINRKLIVNNAISILCANKLGNQGD